MSLIIYPAADYDSFCSVSDATTILDNNLLSISEWTTLDNLSISEWTALDNTNKEKLLRQATLLISTRIKLPDTLETNLKKATAYLANYSIGKDMTNSSSDSNVKIEEIAGTIKTEYFSPNKSDNDFPDIVDMLLSSYGIVQSGSFVMDRA
jgi:hypothetical protein